MIGVLLIPSFVLQWPQDAVVVARVVSTSCLYQQFYVYNMLCVHPLSLQAVSSVLRSAAVAVALARFRYGFLDGISVSM